jgi:hypothetical protein
MMKSVTCLISLISASLSGSLDGSMPGDSLPSCAAQLFPRPVLSGTLVIVTSLIPDAAIEACSTLWTPVVYALVQMVYMHQLVALES